MHTRTLRWLRMATVTCSLLVFAPAAADDATTGGRLVFSGATLIDGTGAPPRSGLSIVVEDERIAAIVADADAPEGERIDVSGLYVLPGLIDTHVHLGPPPVVAMVKARLRRLVHSGVTAVRTMADDVRSVAELSRASVTGEIPAPDIVYSALMAGPEFFDDKRTVAVTRGATPGKTPWMQAIDDDTDLLLAVALARGTSAGGIKLYANLRGDTVARIVAEAHRQGIPAWAHAFGFPASPAEVVASGADVVSHSCLFGFQVMTREGRSPLEPQPLDESLFANGVPADISAVFDSMAARGTILDATNVWYVEFARWSAAEVGRRPPPCDPATSFALTREAWRRGVPISTGTDWANAWEAPLPSLHDELEILGGPVGMPPMDVIVAATRNGAKALGLADEIGTIEAGKRANLVFVSADPLDDVGHLREVVLTVKRGVRYPRDEYVPISREEAGID